MGLLQPIGHTQQKLLPFPLGTPWEACPTPIPPRWMRVSVSSCPFSAVWSSQAGANCLNESCDTVLCSLNGLLLHNRPQLINQKDEGKCGPTEECGEPSGKGRGKGSVDAFFALVDWRSPLSGLPNTCGWQQSLLEWGTACGTNRSDYEPVLWTGHVQGYGTSWASDAPRRANQSYCGGALWPF